MKSNRIHSTCPRHSADGLTLIEVMISILVISILAALLLPTFARAKVRQHRINCVNSLKQIGLAFRMWSNDHGDSFPWRVLTTNGGTLEFAGRPGAFRHYLAISNELSSPKVLACEHDKQRTKASSWDQLTSDARHISYFVGLDSEESKSQSILGGDRNITTNGVRAVGLVAIPMSSRVGWSSELHGGRGNLVFGDGSAYQTMNGPEAGGRFTNYLTTWGGSSVRLVIP